MANHLLASRSGNSVGIKWAANFIDRKEDLKMRYQRKYSYQQAACEDPRIIESWFELVQRTILEYGILDDDIYNFDETGF
jgi:RecB family endonuclease NucS